MRLFKGQLGSVVQNVILGTITGIVVGYNLRLLFVRYGSLEFVWLLFLIIGPALGYFSGRERERMERLKKKTRDLEKDITQIRSALALSTKKYKVLVEQASDSIFLTTQSGEFVLFNEATSLITGYEKTILKKMKIEQLRANSNDRDRPNEWLDNGIHSYEDVWKTRAGQKVTLEIRAKQVWMSDHHLVLHIARDIENRGTGNNGGVHNIRKLHELLLHQSASNWLVVQKEILEPAERSIQIMKGMAKQHVAQYPGIEPTVSDWQKMNPALEGLEAKNRRDLTEKPGRWNLNDIVLEELYAIRMNTPAGKVAVKVQLSSHIVNVYGFGLDFSIALNPLIRACMYMIEGTEEPELKLATKLFRDEVLLEIQAEGVGSVNRALNRAIFIENNEPDGIPDDSDRWKDAFESFLDPFGASMDLSKIQNKLIIRLRIPVLEDVEVSSEGKRKAADLPVL